MDLQLSSIRIVESISRDNSERDPGYPPRSKRVMDDNVEPHEMTISDHHPAILRTMEKLIEAGFPKNSRLVFQHNPETGKTVIEVVDGTTDEILRRIPPEEFRDLIQDAGETTIGLMTDRRV